MSILFAFLVIQLFSLTKHTLRLHYATLCTNYCSKSGLKKVAYLLAKFNKYLLPLDDIEANVAWVDTTTDVDGVDEGPRTVSCCHSYISVEVY